MSSQAHPLRDEVLAALRGLRHPAGLRVSPLLDDPAVRRGLPLGQSDPSLDDLALALCTRLETIIKDLRPEGEENLRQKDWLRYYLLHYSFRRGNSALSIQRTLGISRSYFYQLRSEAVDSVATLLTATTPSAAIVTAPSDASTIAPSIAISLAEPIPHVADFVGRETEFDLYRRHLASQKLAVIHGFAGTGKTALAAQLATERQQAGQPVIWITFYSGINTDLDSFLEVLACALEEFGNRDLRNFVAASAQGARPYPVDTRIHYAVNCLAASGITLCLDDIHLVEDESSLQRFLTRVAPRQQPAHVSLIVTTRSEPLFAQGRYIAPLLGLSDQDAHRLLLNARVDWLDDDDLVQLQRRTEGNAAFLKFFIAWAQTSGVSGLPTSERTAQTRAFIEQLGRSPTSRNFLLGEVMSTLNSVEQSVLKRVALCRQSLNLGITAPLASLFPDCSLGEVNEALTQLERKNLLMRSSGTTLYRLHDLVRGYVLAQLEQSSTRRVELHKLLVHYYAEMGDVLETAFHHCRAGDPLAAAGSLTQHADELVRNGQAAAIVALANEIPAADLPLDRRLNWYDKLGTASQATGDYERALELYTESLRWPDVPTYQQTELHYRLAGVYEKQGYYAEARDHCQIGLDLLAPETVGTSEWVLLTRQMAVLEMRAGHVEQAFSLSSQVIQAMEDNPDLELPRGAIYASHGLICLRRDDLTGAERYMRQGLALSRAEQNLRTVAMTLNNLAYVLYHQGEIENALTYLAEAQEIYEQMADPYGLAVCCGSRASMYLTQQRTEESLPLLDRELELSQQLQNRYLEADALLGLGKAHLQMKQPLEAQNFLLQSLQVSKNIDSELQAEAQAYLRKADLQITGKASR